MVIRANIVFALLLVYLLLSVYLYLFGPIDWHEGHSFRIGFYLTAVILSIVSGWVVGHRYVYSSYGYYLVRDKECFLHDLNGNLYQFVGAVLYLNLILYVSTGELFYQIDFAASLVENYVSMVDFARDREYAVNSFYLVSLLPVLFLSYLMYLYIFFLNKKNLLKWFGFAVVLFFLSVFLFRKAADKEFIEFSLFFMLLFAAYGGVKVNSKNILVSAFVVALILALVFLRKSERTTDFSCVYNYCAYDRTDSVLGQLSFMFTSYVSQGYKGLSLALNSDASPDYNLCVSPMLNGWLQGVFGACKGGGAYIQAINDSRLWSTKGTWSSGVVWWANLFGFYGYLVFVFVLSVLYGVVVRFLQASAGGRVGWKDFIFFVFLFFTTEFYLFLPANNQIFLSFDSMVIYLGSCVYVTTVVLRGYLRQYRRSVF